MAPVECTEEEAAHFKREHGDHVVVLQNDDGQWQAVFKKGAQLYIPKALQFDRHVAGQIPTGWDARRYGVPEDIVQQVCNLDLISYAFIRLRLLSFFSFLHFPLFQFYLG